MDIFTGFFGFLLLILFGGTGRNGRRRAGLFRTYGRHPFASRDIKGHQDPWRKRHTTPRNTFIGRKRSYPPKSGGRYLRRDPWNRKRDSVTRSGNSYAALGWIFTLVGALFKIGISSSSMRSHNSRSHGTRSGRSSHSMTGSYYGHRGEFDTNDSVRARMEDMEQFYEGDHDFNAFEHGYDWDEIVDAVNDGYLPEDYLDNQENYSEDSYGSDYGYEDELLDEYESEDSYEQYDSYDSYDD